MSNFEYKIGDMIVDKRTKKELSKEQENHGAGIIIKTIPSIHEELGEMYEIEFPSINSSKTWIGTQIKTLVEKKLLEHFPVKK